MTKKITFSLSLFLILIFVILVQYLALSSIEDRIEENFVNDFAEQELLIAEEISHNLEAKINTVQEKLKLIAQMPEVRFGDAATCNNKLRQIISEGLFDGEELSRMNAQGKFYCSTNKEFLAKEGSNHDLVKQKIGFIDEILNDEEHKPFLSPVIRTVVDREDYLVALHIPVFDENEVFIGTVSAAIFLSEIKEDYLEDIKFADQGYVVLQDSLGDIIYHPNSEFIGEDFWSDDIQEAIDESENLNSLVRDMFNGETGISSYVFQDKEKVAAYAPAQIFPDRIWGVIVTVPIEDIRKSIKEPIKSVFVPVAISSILISALLILSLFYFVLKGEFLTIGQVTEILKAAESGKKLKSHKHPNGKGDIEGLAMAYRNLAKLRLKNKSLSKDKENLTQNKSS